MIYLDWASTTPPEASLLSEAALLAAEAYGNPSSRHTLGGEARIRLDEARARLGAALGGSMSFAQGEGPAVTASRPVAGQGDSRPRIAFTSGGSEADAIVLLSLLRKKDSRPGETPHIVTTGIEHSAVYEEAKLLEDCGLQVSFVNPRADGLMAPEDVAQAVRKNTALVAVMALNNETGAIQPLAAIAKAVAEASKALGRREPPRFHTDAVQALGKIEFNPASLGVTSAAFSAHKLRGPRGVGALWISGRLEPLVLGGGQEEGIRPGTENLQGAWAFSRAAERAATSFAERRALALGLEARLIEGMAAIGALPLPLGRRPGDPRYAPQILSAALPGLSGEVLVRALSDEGIAVSTGAACSSHKTRQGRRVLDAMGLSPELSLSAIRVSSGETTREADIDRFLDTLGALYRRLKI